ASRRSGQPPQRNASTPDVQLDAGRAALTAEISGVEDLCDRLEPRWWCRGLDHENTWRVRARQLAGAMCTRTASAVSTTSRRPSSLTTGSAWTRLSMTS